MLSNALSAVALPDTFGWCCCVGKASVNVGSWANSVVGAGPRVAGAVKPSLGIGCCWGRDTSSGRCGRGGCSFVGVGPRAAGAVGAFF